MTPEGLPLPQFPHLSNVDKAATHQQGCGTLGVSRAHSWIPAAQSPFPPQGHC